MKKSLFMLLAGIAVTLSSAPLLAAQQYPSVEAARQTVTNDGYILFLYPEGWDRYGKKLCETLISNPGVKAAAGDAALILAPVYQERNEKTNAVAGQVMGNLGYPHSMSDISYPAIVFYEKNGRSYATLHGAALMNASAPEVAKQIKARLDARKEQQALLDKSGSVTDAGEKVRLLLAAARVEGVSWPDRLKETIRSIDPTDAHGGIASLDFGFGAKNNESLEDFLKRLDAVLKNPQLSTWQKQRACAVAIGHIRRTYGMMAGGPLITQYAKAMRELDPESSLGLSADVVIRDWVREYRYGQGWSSEIIPAGPVPMLMHDVPMQTPGTYEVTFKLTTGRDGIRINSLRLMDGEKCIAADNSPVEVGWSHTVHTYTFTVKEALAAPVLEITYGNAPDKRSTWGEISVKAL